ACSSVLSVPGSPTDPRPRNFNVQVRGTLTRQVTGGGEKTLGAPSATPPRPGKEITVPPDAVALLFHLDITDAPYIRGQAGGPVLKVFYKLPSTNCFNKTPTYQLNLSAHFIFNTSQGRREADARQSLNVASDC